MSVFAALTSFFGKLSVTLFLGFFALLGVFHLHTPPPARIIPGPSAAQTQAASSPLKQSVATTIPKVASAKKAPEAPVAAKPKSDAATSSAPALQIPKPPPSAASLEALNAQARAALVNILCTTAAGGSFEPISGSGSIIDSRGVILTNAHVAQFFLLRNYRELNDLQCSIRTGSPARAAYTADLLYLPPQWVDANASQIGSSEATGTGQNDYAFLLIDGTIDASASLPSSFPAVAINDANPAQGDQMLLASYPAGFLSGINIQSNLYAASAYASVGQIYVFNSADQWIDLFSIPDTIVSQAGSSGGEALRESDGELAGIIATESIATSTGARDLRAVTLAHIEHSLESQGINGFNDLLSGDLYAKAAIFNKTTALSEGQKLIDALNSTRPAP